jgi:hypothetical protein
LHDRAAAAGCARRIDPDVGTVINVPSDWLNPPGLKAASKVQRQIAALTQCGAAGCGG